MLVLAALVSCSGLRWSRRHGWEPRYYWCNTYEEHMTEMLARHMDSCFKAGKAEIQEIAGNSFIVFKDLYSEYVD